VIRHNTIRAFGHEGLRVKRLDQTKQNPCPGKLLRQGVRLDYVRLRLLDAS
jgi:hypothetical protein